jgi:hypothetical protein
VTKKLQDDGHVQTELDIDILSIGKKANILKPSKEGVEYCKTNRQRRKRRGSYQ